MVKISKKRQQARRKRSLNNAYIYVLSILIFIISMRGLYWSITDSWWGYQSQAWPWVAGTVTSATPNLSYNKGTKMYSPEVVYKYRIAGTWYQNDVYSFPTNRTSSINEVNAQLAAYPQGSKTRIFYEPSNPQTSCLVTGYSFGFTLFFLPLSLILLAFSLWLFVAALKQ